MTSEQERAFEIITSWLRNEPDALDEGSEVTFSVFKWLERDRILVSFKREAHK